MSPDNFVAAASGPQETGGFSRLEAFGRSCHHGSVEADILKSELDYMARPLLELMQRISGLETTFITRIDWADQRQEVMFALNTSPDLEVAEESMVDWSDSMCRWVFLSGKEQSTDVSGDFPGSLGADRLGMQTFFAVPILFGEDEVMGTVCGASRDVVPVAEETLELMRLVSRAMAHQMQAEVSVRAERARADDAEQQSASARAQAASHATNAEAMEVLAFSDALTQLPNQRAFVARFEAELARSGRHDYPIAVLRIDVDSFKTINDTFGHEAGDRVLASLGDVLLRVSRAEDLPARPGGDEFVLVVPYADLEGATAVAVRIQRAIIAASLQLALKYTVSIGISSSMLTPRRQLLEAADRALYQMKNSGRDGFRLWPADLGSAAGG